MGCKSSNKIIVPKKIVPFSTAKNPQGLGGSEISSNSKGRFVGDTWIKIPPIFCVVKNVCQKFTRKKKKTTKFGRNLFKKIYLRKIQVMNLACCPHHFTPPFPVAAHEGGPVFLGRGPRSHVILWSGSLGNKL